VKKALSGVYSSPKGHWVGDGVPVRSLFSDDGLGRQLGPFLLLDYAGSGARPFVMNSRQEIETAVDDFQRGKFGHMPAAEAQTADA
jgi:redox-sensitive bicupin YhaK (pirin superfamily)